MKNEENIKRDWITKIENNNLKVVDYVSFNKVKCDCNICGYSKTDNCRNLGYKKYKCKYCILKEKSLLLKDGKINILEINGDKLKIECKDGHIYYQDRRNLLKGKYCLKCFLLNKIITQEEFIKRSIDIHGEEYEYNLEDFKNLHSKIEIKCNKNHVFIQKASNHLQGKGCPICRESLGERSIKKYLDDKGIIYNRQKSFEDCKNQFILKFDFYLPEKNSIIEYDGIQHFESVKIFGGEKKFEILKRCDYIKNNYCNDKGIKLLRISYQENINDKLNNFFVNIKNEIY